MVMDLNYLSNDQAKFVTVVCRLCINATGVSYPISYLNGLLSDILPDLDFSLSKDPVACMSCVNLVTASFNFKKMCLETERQVRDYCEGTSNPVNLYTLVEKQHCDIPAKNSIWKIQTQETSDYPSSNLETINSIISIVQAEQSKKVLLENENRKTIFEPKLENIKRISKKNNETKELSCLEENKHIVRIKEPPGVSNYNMSEVVEIVESDINSDVELEFSEDEDIISFKEFCCQGANVNDQEYGKEGLLDKFEIEDEDCIQIVDHEVESDMIFIEEFNQDSCNTGKKKVEEKIDTNQVMVTDEKTTSLSPKKSPLSNNILSENDPKISTNILRGQLCQRVKKNLFICVICCKEFTQKILVNRHLLDTHKDIPDIQKKVDSKIHFCQFCTYHTINKPTLAVHLASIHNKVTKRKTARSSPNKFPQSNNILSILSENGSKISRNISRAKLCRRINKKLFMCMICCKSFAQKLHVNSHLLTKHKDIPNIEKKVDSKIHFCQYCSFRTLNNYNLAIHLVNRHNKRNTMYKRQFKEYFCAHCEYSTENKGNLVTHVRIHNLLKFFQCYLCDRSFNQKALLDRHILRSHTV